MWRLVVASVFGLLATAMSVLAVWVVATTNVTSAPYEPGGEITGAIPGMISFFLWLVSWLPGITAIVLAGWARRGLTDARLRAWATVCIVLGFSPGLVGAYAVLFL